MKINWGTAIVIAFALFISFILYFVIKATTQQKYSYDLVSEEYYNDELKYQTDIDAMQHFKDLGININVETSKKGIHISFPNNFKTESTDGNIVLYRPSNQSLDFEIPFDISKHTSLLIPDNKLVDGRWDLKIKWSYNDTTYLYKKEIVY